MESGINNRRTYLDVLKVIAIFFVLYIHSGETILHHYMIEGGKISHCVAMTIQQLAMTCNNTFFFVTGILLLGREESAKDLFRKRILKYIIIIIVFGLLQYAYSNYVNPEIGFEIGVAAKIIYSSTIITPYWFLHTYLAFLIILPFLRILIRNMSEKHVMYLLILYVVINGVLPLVELLWKNDRISLDIVIFANIIIYPFFGYYLDKYWYEKLEKRKLLWAVNIAGVAALILNVWYMYAELVEGLKDASSDGLTMIIVAAIYCDVRFLFARVKNGKVWAVFGRATIVIYLLGNIMQENTYFIYEALENRISWLGAAIVWLGTDILIGTAVSIIYELLKKGVRLTVKRLGLKLAK